MPEENLAQELINQGTILGYVDNKDCEIFIKDTLKKGCEKKGQENGVFINISFLEGDRKSVPTRIDKITFYPTNQPKDKETRAALITRALKDCQKNCKEICKRPKKKA